MTVRHIHVHLHRTRDSGELGGQRGPRIAPSAGERKHKFKVGQRVQFEYLRGKWAPAVITELGKVMGAGPEYTIKYRDPELQQELEFYGIAESHLK